MVIPIFTPKPYKMSDKGLQFTAKSEGFRRFAYNDNGHQAIAYGHDILPGESFPGEISESDGLILLRADMAKAEAYVNKFITVPLTQGQVDACCDFCFNVGGGSLETSTFRKLLNDGDYSGACQQLFYEDEKGMPHGWIYSGGKVNNGLIERRKGEQELFNS